ncbi:hypothetical protein SELMODRAFT_448052 [Selaginella moellendorffii]|uniref:At4g15545-like C-terminal domain-containing protein n=1 Tax=Selaginella moellendorffii TaxID=88036 RepID=D8T4H7_SELML|nr:uncharacterized protein At4g15545 [Selaginella moellendorffii]XP_024544680.1 uncharacterized protein At4g15545 [Selaginella moellendorffii]EFJ08357.1 hypothetical protein SELMODRAFT_448052 [Selaginella moellendorffii]|eukprot:XP_002990480.1 uncharacterized protein At4g15545 [Selaginella moellendorffii]
MMGVDFDLPKEVLSVLPTDPFEQLDLARRITSMAITLRVAKLEADEKKLMQKVAERDKVIYELKERLSETEHNLQDAMGRLTTALDEQTKLTNERNVLMSTVKKLNRDVAKLEAFKRTLMQSLQEDEDGGTESGNRVKDADTSGSGQDDIQDAQRNRTLSLTPTLTPKLSPIGSPKDLSASVTPLQLSAPGSPRRLSAIEPRFASLPASHTITAPSSPPIPGRTPKVDGKEFFRQARNRLSYEQFSAFLANIKELNAHRQTREETLRKAGDIFGADNKDLYLAFEGLLSRHLPS